MSAGEKVNGSKASIDTILRRLTDRPDVESALILSRKDGSIIVADGFSSAESRRRAQSTAGYTGDGLTRTKAEGEDTNPMKAETESSPVVSPAEELAVSIFQFVKSASSLGATLCTVAAEIENNGTSLTTSQQRDRAVNTGNTKGLEEHQDLRGEAQVQLLRLRIKTREIIIFPDPQYLCCAVQKVGKQ